jgi:hypothetical protein
MTEPSTRPRSESAGPSPYVLMLPFPASSDLRNRRLTNRTPRPALQVLNIGPERTLAQFAAHVKSKVRECFQPHALTCATIAMIP